MSRSLSRGLAALAFTVAAPGCASSSPPARTAASAGEPVPQTAPLAVRPPAPQAIPAELREDRFFVVLRLASGESLTLYTDSGGGSYNLAHRAAVRLHLPVTEETVDGEQLQLAALPPLAPGQVLPPLPGLGGRLVVAPASDDDAFVAPADGMLGARWFKDRVWTFDYPRHQLWLHAAGDVPAGPAAHRVALGFQVDAAHERTTSFARIPIRVDGEAMDMLFDTGATVRLSPEAVAALGDGRGADRATSFIAQTTFDAWHARHPDWRMIEGADANARGQPIICVPQIEVAGFTVGPVWFTRRPDANFHTWMSSMMDRRINGALGGSALRYFRVTLDYPGAVAVFVRPRDGEPPSP